MRTLLVALSIWSPIQHADEAVQEVVQRLRTPVLQEPMQAISDFARRDIVLAALLGMAVWGGPQGIAAAKLAVVSSIAANLVVEGVKRTVQRTRPDGERNPSNSSFPSSHAANAFLLAAVLAPRRKRLAPVFWAFAVLVAFSRLYLNRHYLSDVVVGAAIGLLCVWPVARWLESRAPREARKGGAGAA